MNVTTDKPIVRERYELAAITEQSSASGDI